jgi:uncharacterized membrane protein YbhN (UPF0104 family)
VKVPINFSQSLSLTLLGSSLNLVLPSKLGDLLKIYFVAKEDHVKELWPCVIYEKTIDVVSLSLLCIIPLIMSDVSFFLKFVSIACCATILSIFIVIFTVRLWKIYLFRKMPKFLIETNVFFYELGLQRQFAFLSISLFLWVIHLLQFSAFFYMLGFSVSIIDIFARIPLAIYAGLLPLTIAGVGVRDFVIIQLFQHQVLYEICVLVGLFATFRYVLPGLLGLPVLLVKLDMVKRYLTHLKKVRK